MANSIPPVPAHGNAYAAGHEAVPVPTAQLMRFGDILDAFGDEAEAAHQARRTGRALGPISGLPTLDRELSGAWLPGLHWVHGNAGAGKTAFALQIAAMCGAPALFVSCEMSPVELLRRHTARATETYLGRLKSGEMTRTDAEKLAHRAIAQAPDLCLADATCAAAPVGWIADAARIVRDAAQDESEKRHVFIVIDSFHSWATRLANGLTEYESLGLAITDLQTLAHTLSCPILAICERNRGSMNGGGLNAGAGTRKIEYSGETVIDLNRAEEAHPNADGEVLVKLRFSKNRHGAAGRSVDLMFDGALQRFREDETCPSASTSTATSELIGHNGATKAKCRPLRPLVR